MKFSDNIGELGNLKINYMGFIFYEKSPRNIEIKPNIKLSKKIERVGVFVNADINTIIQKTNEFNLDIIQLHGNESPEFCRELNKTMPIIKAFSIAEASDFERTEHYHDLQGYFLFDTKTPHYGGSGQKFDWNILNAYKGEIPFFLSGGISEDDVQAIKKIKHPKLVAIDLNSKFEIEPGLKNINKLEKFITEIRL